MRYTTKHKTFMSGFNTAKLFNMYNEKKQENLIDVFYRLQRLSKKHHLLCEFACNGFKTTEEEQKNDSEIKHIETLFNGTVKSDLERYYLKGVGTLKAEFQYDPRGLTCKLILIDAQGTERDISNMYLMEWW